MGPVDPSLTAGICFFWNWLDGWLETGAGWNLEMGLAGWTSGWNLVLELAGVPAGIWSWLVGLPAGHFHGGGGLAHLPIVISGFDINF